MSGGSARDGVGGTHRCAEPRQRVAARKGSDQERVATHRVTKQAHGKRKGVDGVECADRHHQVEAAGGRLPMVLDDRGPSRRFREKRPRVADQNAIGHCAEPLRPLRIRTADEHRVFEAAPKERDPIETVGEGAFVEEQLRAGAGRAVPAQRAQFHVEQLRHRPLVRCAAISDKTGMVVAFFGRLARGMLDFALPPRCAGCGTIVADVHSFCPDCWTDVEFRGETGCTTCGMPLQATEQATCGACLARAPRIARTRAAVAYGELARGLAIRLKYGRKVAIARTMARYMAPLVGSESDRLLVPVPLHRTRLWGRGFNQSALVARELSRRLGIPADPLALSRTRRTPPLKGMSPIQRRKTVAGAFRVRDKQRIAGKTVILVDDVLTTGSTAEACARTLKRAGAARVELVSWARVVKPSQLMR